MALLANEFSKTSFIDVHLIIYGNDVPAVYDLVEGVTVHRPEFKFNKRFRLLSTLRRLLFLRATLRRGRYDAILSFGERWNSFVMLAALGLREKIYLSDRSSPRLDIGWGQTCLRRLLYPRATGLLAQTRQARDMAIERGLNERIDVVPNPVVMPQIASESRREKIILSVGRMVSTKNFDHLIEIFAALNADEWKLIIVGDDSQGQNHKSYLIDLAKRLGVSDRVAFAGERADVQSFYDQAKIFCTTSSSEGFPNVVAEALASGLPVVSYDCVAGPSDLIASGENGYLIDLFDQRTFRQRLGELVFDEGKRMQMSIKARESVARLSVGLVASRVLEIMQIRESR